MAAVAAIVEEGSGTPDLTGVTMHPAASAERVTTSEGKRPPAPWIPLLAWLSLVLAALIWGASLWQSLELASVGDALVTRQLELEALVQQSPAASSLAPFGIEGADRRLLEHLEAMPDATTAPVLIERAVLEQHLGQGEAARRHLATARDLGDRDLQELSRQLLAPSGQPQRLPARPIYRQLICAGLERPDPACPTPADLRLAGLRLLLINLLPLLGVISGSALALRLLWQVRRGRLPAAPPLQGPDLAPSELLLILAGGFVVLGQILTPLLVLPAVQQALEAADLTPAARDAAGVVLIYVASGLPALALLALLLRGRGPVPEGGWLQWRPAPVCLVQGLRGLLLSLPAVALSGWLVEQLWPDVGGSNPLLQQVLDSRDHLALGLLALTAIVVAPLFEELLFRGVLLPVIGRTWGPLPAVVTSALVFALAHLSFSEALPLLALGLVLGWLRLQTGRLLSCTLMHGLWNGFTFLNLLLLGS